MVQVPLGPTPVLLPGGLRSRGSQRARHNCVTEQAHAGPCSLPGLWGRVLPRLFQLMMALSIHCWWLHNTNPCLFSHSLFVSLCVLFCLLLSLLILLLLYFSRSVVSNSLRPHEPQHARPPCPSPTPRVHSDSRTSSQ